MIAEIGDCATRLSSYREYMHVHTIFSIFKATEGEILPTNKDSDSVHASAV